MSKTDQAISALAKAFRAARQAAEKAAAVEDGGTCNLDTAVYRPEPSVRKAVIEDAARIAGVRISIRDWLGRAVFLYVSQGQANRNTRMAEAAASALKDAGLKSTVYYQVD